MNELAQILSDLDKTIKQRKESGSADDSYIASLFAKGRKKIAQKVGEEGVELALAAATNDREEMIKESADLLLHMLVLLNDADISTNDIAEELRRREGTSGLEEKASRKG